MDRRMDKAMRALTMAVSLRKPQPSLVCHADRCSQHASHAASIYLRRYGMHPSMSRKGNCWDNAGTLLSAACNENGSAAGTTPGGDGRRAGICNSVSPSVCILRSAIKAQWSTKTLLKNYPESLDHYKHRTVAQLVRPWARQRPVTTQQRSAHWFDPKRLTIDIDGSVVPAGLWVEGRGVVTTHVGARCRATSGDHYP